MDFRNFVVGISMALLLSTNGSEWKKRERKQINIRINTNLKNLCTFGVVKFVQAKQQIYLLL